MGTRVVKRGILKSWREGSLGKRHMDRSVAWGKKGVKIFCITIWVKNKLVVAKNEGSRVGVDYKEGA